MVGISQTIPEPHDSVWQVSEVFATLDMYFDVADGIAKDRPNLNVTGVKQLTVNEDWIVTDIPEGTEVEIDGEVVGTVDNTGLTLSFSAAGVWQVNLHPPFPWIEASCEVTVT
jgi:hypothetical protein